MEELIEIKIDGDSVTIEGWEWNEGVKNCKSLYKRLKDDFAGTVLEFWRAHKAIVQERIYTDRTWKEFCEEVGIDEGTPRRWFDSLNLRPAIAGSSKPPKKHTKPDMKLQLNNIGEAIKKGEVSDDDVKGLLKNTAEAIDEGICHTRVASDVISIARKKAKEKSLIPQNNERGELENIKLIIQKASDRMWEIPSDEKNLKERGDLIHWKAIKNCGPAMIWHFARLGINPRKVMDFMEGQKNANDRTQIESYIEAEWKALD